MKIITQKNLFDYSEIEILGDLERCKMLIDNVPDRKIVEKLKEIRGKGRDDYPVAAVWNAILIMPLLEHSTVEQLRRELSRNSDLRAICGFSKGDYILGKCKLVPPPKAFSNVFSNLKKIEDLLKDCFNDLRDFMLENLEGYGSNAAEDGKLFLSNAKGKSDNLTDADARTETDADYTKKESYVKDKDGVSKVKTKFIFGFRMHLLADVDYELPLEYTVTPASYGERKQLVKHLEMLPKKYTTRIQTLSADKGYDGEELIKKVKSYDIKPIIDIREMWKDSETKQYKDTDIVYNNKGEVFLVTNNCETIKLKYEGYDKTRNTLRYSNGKKIYSINITEDERIFTPIARDSTKFKLLYNKRTAIERINGRLDRDLNLENHKVRGLKKATVIIDIMLISMMSLAKGHIINKNPEKLRKLKTS